jgi:hypothetical protein
MAPLARVVMPGLGRSGAGVGTNRGIGALFARSAATAAGASPLCAQSQGLRLSAGAQNEAAVETIRCSRTTGRPVSAKDWIKALEAATSRPLARSKRGRKPRAVAEAWGELFHTVSP